MVKGESPEKIVDYVNSLTVIAVQSLRHLVDKLKFGRAQSTLFHFKAIDLAVSEKYFFRNFHKESITKH